MPFDGAELRRTASGENEGTGLPGPDNSPDSSMSSPVDSLSDIAGLFV